MKFGILGGGFGLYGYLPALCELDFELHLLDRYKKSVYQRIELHKYASRLIYHDNEFSLIKNVNNLVIARIPENQFNIVSNLPLDIKSLFLEKPLSQNFTTHSILLQKIQSSGKTFSVGYLFPFSQWWTKLVNIFCQGTSKIVLIEWGVVNPQNNWKSNPNVGGSIADFYGIHFVPLFHEIKCKISDLRVTQTNSELIIRVYNSTKVSLQLTIKYSNNNNFTIRVLDFNDVSRELYAAETPFGVTPKLGERDPRVDLIKNYIKDSNRTHSSFLIELLAIDFRKVSFESLVSAI